MTTKEFQHTVAPIKDKLYRFALRMLDNIPEAQDVVQEVLIKVWQQRERLAQVTNMEAWTMRMTRNMSIDKMRSKHRRTEDVSGIVQFATAAPTPDLLAEQADTMQHISNIIAQLPEKQRNVMHLRDVEGYSYQEVADALNLPLNQVKVNLFRARKAVRMQLATSGVLNSL